jgi:hypothetical protein
MFSVELQRKPTLYPKRIQGLSEDRRLRVMSGHFLVRRDDDVDMFQDAETLPCYPNATAVFLEKVDTRSQYDLDCNTPAPEICSLPASPL